MNLIKDNKFMSEWKFASKYRFAIRGIIPIQISGVSFCCAAKELERKRGFPNLTRACEKNHLMF
jgi:hypothetical protein